MKTNYEDSLYMISLGLLHDGLTKYDANKKPRKFWACAFEENNQTQKHQCKPKQTEVAA
jgi:hypothetical protein